MHLTKQTNEIHSVGESMQSIHLGVVNIPQLLLVFPLKLSPFRYILFWKCSGLTGNDVIITGKLDNFAGSSTQIIRIGPRNNCANLYAFSTIYTIHSVLCTILLHYEHRNSGSHVTSNRRSSLFQPRGCKVSFMWRFFDRFFFVIQSYNIQATEVCRIYTKDPCSWGATTRGFKTSSSSWAQVAEPWVKSMITTIHVCGSYGGFLKTPKWFAILATFFGIKW